MAGMLSGADISMATQALLTGATAGIYGGSTARLLSGTGITPATVTQDALMGGANGLIFYGVASAYQQVAAPKPSTTSLQERASLAAQMGEAEGCAGNGINKIPDNNSITRHIFRDSEGHIPNTPENRALLESVANNAENFRGIDKYGNEWYTEILENGMEVWVESRNGNIFEGGINEMPKLWNPNTGLKRQ